MSSAEYVLLDTKAIDASLAWKENLIQRYDAITTEFDSVVSALEANWKGRGATAFMNDVRTVKANIVGIYDILKIMCDTLTDIKQIIEECDSGLGDYNRNSNA